MELVLNATKPPLLTLTPTGGTFFVFGDVLVYVIHPGNSSDKELAFVLGAVSIQWCHLKYGFMKSYCIEE